MQKYLLFIDTETTDLPGNWNLPYSTKNNWPYAVQISWVIYTADGRELKREDHYINNKDFAISQSAFKIHGITRLYLDEHGESRNSVLNLLANDLNEYEPLVVGHFVELDYNIAGVDFYREGMENPMSKLPRFCTMLATTQLVRNPQIKYLKLGQLYTLLFEKPLLMQHNAMADALATAESFFELLRRDDINDEKIAAQQAEREKAALPLTKSGCILPVLFLIALTVLIAHWI